MRFSRARRRRLLSDLVALVLVLALIGSAYLLPQDTSLSQVRKTGLLRACVPDSYPPLVTGDAQRPGIDVEILESVATDMGLRLTLSTNSAIGEDFNPRNWRLSRAQCQVVAGGVIDSPLTRSFLSLTPAHLDTGWALVMPEKLDSLQGRRVGFFAPATGLDRVALGTYFRRQGADVFIVSSREELIAGLETGQLEAAVSESLTARQIAGVAGWEVQWLPSDLGRYRIAFGLWKGDLTLEQRMERTLKKLAASGEIGAIVESYDLGAISEVCTACAP